MVVTEADAQGIWMTHVEIMKKLREDDDFSFRTLDAAWAVGRAGTIGKDVTMSVHGDEPQSDSCLKPGIRPMVMVSIPVVWFFTKLTLAQMRMAENQMTKARRDRNNQQVDIMQHNRKAALAMAEKSALAGAESGSPMRC